MLAANPNSVTSRYDLGLALAYVEVYAPIRARQEARQLRERKKFLVIVCNDNPYATVWQPAERTCKRFSESEEN